MSSLVTPEHAQAQTRAWLSRCVVAMNLCPFARPVLDSPSLCIAVCDAGTNEGLQQAFLNELDRLQSSSESEIATTLLVFNRALADFDDYLDFLDDAQYLLESAGLLGVIQLASFHPQYRFEGEAADAASNYSNRSPWPTLHLLREAMVTRMVAAYPNVAGIPAKNIALLESLGSEYLQDMLSLIVATQESD